jgi:hypothetical protein
VDSVRLATHREGMADVVANGWRTIGLDRLEHTVNRAPGIRSAYRNK